VANVVAGTILTYTRAFEIGDRVRIADTVGDVIEKTLLATRVQTVKNEIVTVPNALVLGSHITNFSGSPSPRAQPLILHTTVTIGYDAPWRMVHELLIAAALRTSGIQKNPNPFVLQTSLDDFYVHYQINAYTAEPGRMTLIYAELHQNIQDCFNEAGVEIMSPHFSSLRDGNRKAVPGDYLPKTYAAPMFRVGRNQSTAAGN
jgi:small-conductance mechanosensitive channel